MADIDLFLPLVRDNYRPIAVSRQEQTRRSASRQIPDGEEIPSASCIALACLSSVRLPETNRSALRGGSG